MAATYGDRYAEIYDELFGHMDAAPAVDAIRKLANGGQVLELGIGTGRVALPLAAAGVRVHGVDASERMVERLRAKPGGESLSVTIGDFAELDIGETFSVVFIAFNTLFALLTQEKQARCFERVAVHLSQSGIFITETFVPDPTRFDRGQTLRTVEIEDDRVVLEASLHDAANQRVRSALIVQTPGSQSLYPLEIRYAWPSELDLMGASAGFRLRERWADWRGAPFTSRSAQCISIFERV
jgi:SAM-dependent methyltransferase